VIDILLHSFDSITLTNLFAPSRLFFFLISNLDFLDLNVCCIGTWCDFTIPCTKLIHKACIFRKKLLLLDNGFFPPGGGGGGGGTTYLHHLF
jgi:hypothetical protein